VTLWAIATGQISDLAGFTGRVESVAFSPDGRILASSENEPQPPPPGQPRRPASSTTVRLWDLATGQATRLSSMPDTYGGSPLAFHPSGRTLAGSAGMDGTIRLLDLAAGQVTTLTGHTSGINAAAFSPDGRTLATGSTDTTIRLWDLATGQTTITVNPHGGYVAAVTFSPDGRTLASASTDNTVRLWDPATGQATATLFGHTGFVTSVAFSPDGHTLATGSSDGTVRLWTLGRLAFAGDGSEGLDAAATFAAGEQAVAGVADHDDDQGHHEHDRAERVEGRAAVAAVLGGVDDHRHRGVPGV